MSARTPDPQPARGRHGMTNPAVSIVLPTYDRASLIGRSIRSVLAQTYTDFELIVVDDGSLDDTADVVARFDDPRIAYLRLEQNRGAAAARNAGIRQAAAQFLAFQDSDDEWLPEKLKIQMQSFARCDAGVGIVYSDMQRIQRNGESHYHRSPDISSGALINASTCFYQVCRLGIQSTVIRRECLQAVGGFNEAFPALEDLELFIRLSRHYRFHHLEMPLVRYHETDGLSRDEPAKVVARTLLLGLYRQDLQLHHPDFLVRELASLRATEQTQKDTAGGT
jgi:glycosyltransferase involved in cell wall biosynthesis